MVDRRILIAATLGLTLVRSFPKLAGAQSGVTEIDVDGAMILGLSPDAATLVAVRDLERLEFIDVESLEIRATSDKVVEFALIERSSMSWSPSGSHVAFSLDAWRLGRNSDIFTVDANTAEVANLTYEGSGEVANSLIRDEESVVDVFPAWRDDETLVFARHRMPADALGAGLYTISPLGGEPTLLLDLAGLGIRYVTRAIHQTAGGKLVTTVEGADRRGRIFLLDERGEASVIDPPFEGYPDVLAADETHYLTMDINERNAQIWRVPYDGTEPETINDLFGLEATTGWRALPIFGPEQGSILHVHGEGPVVSVFDGEGVREVATLPEREAITRMYWEESTAILCGGTSNWMLDMSGED